MNESALKALRLVGIAVAITAPIIAYMWWFGGPPPKKAAAATPTPPPVEVTEAAPAPEVPIEPLPVQTTPLSLEQQLAKIKSQIPATASSNNPYNSGYTPSKTGAQLAKAAGASNPSSDSGGSSGGGGGKKGGGGSGGGSSGGGSGGGTAAAPAATTPDPTATEDVTNSYWLGDDGLRHNSSCPSFRNVPGKECKKADGQPDPACGG